jgi:outer membrane protein
MFARRVLVLVALGTSIWFAVVDSGVSSAQESKSPAGGVPPAPQPIQPPAAVVRLTLEEAAQRAVTVNKLLALGAMNVESKGYATRAVQANYFPQSIGASAFMHFSDPLGDVLSIRGRPLLGLPPRVFDVNVLNQESSWSTIFAIQPITDLLKVRQGVRIGRADEAIAQAQVDKGTREVISGAEQLYWGILAVRKIKAGAEQGVQGTELMLSKLQTLEVRTALVEAKLGLQDAAKQLASLEEQLNNLLDYPPCTVLELVEPPPPVLPFACCDEAISLALAASPEVREAQATIEKASAAVAAGKLDYVPSIAAAGGYLNQTAMDYVQQNSAFIGVIGTYTFVDWGKRRNTIRERQTLHAMAVLKLQQTEDDVRQKTAKAFREFQETAQGVVTAGELVAVRTEATKTAANPDAMLKAAKKLALAQVDYVKAELAHQQAYVQLMTLIGK